MRAATAKTKPRQTIRAKKRQARTARKPQAPSPKPASWRAAIDWAAAGRKAYETKMRNLAAAAAAPVAPTTQTTSKD